MSTGRTIFATDPLIRMFYSQLDARFKPKHESEAEHIESLFLKKLVQQQDVYTQIVQSSLTTIENEPLGVNIAPLNARDIDNLQQEYNDEEQIQALIKAGKRENLIEDALSERDMQIITNILRNLKKDGLLYNVLVENHAYGTSNKLYSELDRKTVVMVALQNAGLLPVIQYVICDSLLTGGRGCGQAGTSVTKTPAALIQELSPLIAATGFTWDDFFILGNQTVVLHKSIIEMAIALDSPEILLAVMRKDKFVAKDIEQPQDRFVNESIEDLVIASGKKAIEQCMHADIIASRAAVPSPKKEPATTILANITSWATEKLTPTHHKMSAASEKRARAPATIALSPYGSGSLHLHASKAIKPLPDNILCLLVSAVSNIIYAAEKYIEKYPQPVKKIVGKHSHQKAAALLVSSGKKFHEEIIIAAATDVAKIALKFLLTFNASTSNLSTGELSKLVLTQKTLQAISLAARTIKNRNCDNNTAVTVKNSLEYLSGLSVSRQPAHAPAHQHKKL
jgi:hypothetical protein